VHQAGALLELPLEDVRWHHRSGATFLSPLAESAVGGGEVPKSLRGS
jgi:hypothetical protein